MSRTFVVSAMFSLLCVTLAPANTKQSVGVMSLKSGSGVSADDAELLSDRLRIELFNTGEFAVMERSQMQEILKEQGFQQSGACSDEGCMVEMGQMLGVNLLIGGSIGRLGNMYLINLRAIDIKTARIAAVVSEDIDGSIENLVRALPRIASRLANKGTPQPQQKPVQVKEEKKNEPVPAAVPEPPRDPRCDKKVYLTGASFTLEQIGAQKLSQSEMDKLNKEITEIIEEKLDECLFNDVTVADQAYIDALAECRAIVIIMQLNNYTTRPGQRNQVRGTAEVTFSYFDGVDASTPFHTEVIKAEGSQHWEEYIPFKNSFDAIAEIIMKHDMGSYMRDVRARIRKL